MPKKIPETSSLLEGLAPIEGRLPEELRSAAIRAAVTAAETAVARRNAAEIAYRREVDEAEAAVRRVAELLARVRATVKGTYGPDSHEYAAVGGKRKSEHKKPARKPQTGDETKTA
jgi:hypothetical protein